VLVLEKRMGMRGEQKKGDRGYLRGRVIVAGFVSSWFSKKNINILSVLE
jgi:hypothetical protein